MTSAYAQSPSCPRTYGAWPAPATLTSAVSRSQCVQNDCSMRWGRVIVRTPTIACEERAFAVPPRCLACRWVSRHFRHHDRIVLDLGEKLAYPSKPVRFAQTAVIHRCRPEWVQPDLKRSLRLSRREVRSWGKLPVAPFDVLMSYEAPGGQCFRWRSRRQRAPSRNQPCEQRFSLSEIGRVETVGKPTVDRSEKIACLFSLALITP